MHIDKRNILFITYIMIMICLVIASGAFILTGINEGPKEADKIVVTYSSSVSPVATTISAPSQTTISPIGYITVAPTQTSSIEYPTKPSPTTKEPYVYRTRKPSSKEPGHDSNMPEETEYYFSPEPEVIISPTPLPALTPRPIHSQPPTGDDTPDETATPDETQSPVETTEVEDTQEPAVNETVVPTEGPTPEPTKEPTKEPVTPEPETTLEPVATEQTPVE